MSFFPYKKSLLIVLFALLAGCSHATSIQDLGWGQQSTISSPDIRQQQPQSVTADQAPARAPFYASFGQKQQPNAAQQAQNMPFPAEQGTGQAVSPAGVPAVGSQNIRVALLVPLSGPHAALGQAMANAAQLAVFDMGINQFELLPRDTKGTTQGAQAAVRDALASGASLIIGPLFAANVAAVKPVVMASQVNMLGLSTDMSLAGPRTYMMGFAPEPQIERLIDYAAEQGLHKYAAMIPPGPYGALVRKAFDEAVKRHGGTIVVEDTLGDTAAIISHQGDIDALFIPYGGEALRQLSAKLEQAGMAPGQVQLLGTGLWDAPNVAGESNLLLGGWYAAPEPELRDHFTKGYVASFGSEPPRLATLAYDATALAVVLARNQMGYGTQALEARTGFAGVDGLFRLLPNGRVERGLAINKITYTGSQVIDESPKNFIKPEYVGLDKAY